jgi:hypothetical protein
MLLYGTVYSRHGSMVYLCLVCCTGDSKSGSLACGAGWVTQSPPNFQDSLDLVKVLMACRLPVSDTVVPRAD